MLTQKDYDEYQLEGFVAVEGMISTESVSAIQESFGILVEKLGEESQGSRGSVKTALQHYASMKTSSPKVASAIYDTLTTSAAVQGLFLDKKILEGVSYLLGIDQQALSHFFRCLRIDPAGENPNELDWHQDFQDSATASLDASDGLTVWIPLTPVGLELGSLELCRRSQHERIESVKVKNQQGQNLSQKIEIDDSESEKYDRVIIEAEPGTAVFMNMNVLHRSHAAPSGSNWRFTALGRYFDFSSQHFVLGAQRFVPSDI